MGVMAASGPRLRVLHSCNHLLIVEKPVGWLSQPNGSRVADVLTAAKAHVTSTSGRLNPFLSVAHRLDRNVGGVLCCARTSKAASRFDAAMRAGKCRKQYVALVRGPWRHANGTLHATLVKGGLGEATTVLPASHTAATSNGDGCNAAAGRLPSSMYVQRLPLDCPGGAAAVLVTLHSGRKHQIRAMLAHFGSPVVGDTRYGGSGAAGSDRALALHAVSLHLPHPTLLDTTVTARSAVPDGWARWLTSAGLQQLRQLCDESLE